MSEHSNYVIKKVAVDGLLIFLLCFGLYITTWYVTPFKRGFFCNDESLMFPYKDDTVTVFMLRMVGLGVPIMGFLLCELVLLRKQDSKLKCFSVRIPAWIRSFYCVSVSFLFGTLFVELTAVVAKSTIGRPRPHFFDVCQPSVNCSAPEWQHKYIQGEDYKCTGDNTDKFQDMTMSFLSGHSAWAAYTMIYFALYLEDRMVWAGSRSIRLTLQFVTVMLSWYTALSRVSDYKHHWSDVLAGYSLGVIVAVLIWKCGTELVKKNSKKTSIQTLPLTTKQALDK